jgi:hypothetical protein
MAASLLEAWGATPTVTHVEIDAAGTQVKNSQNTAISDLESKGTLRWTQKDEALPMPVPMKDSLMALAVKSSDFTAKFNQETLRVTGLEAANYELTINGHLIGNFASEALASGINLAEFDTPMSEQAAQVHDLTIKRADIHNIRWRQIQVPLQSMLPARASAVEDNLDALDNDLAAIQRATAQPAACQYELIPVP